MTVGTVLGIESSCDETAVALLRENTLLSSVVLSQTKTHKPYGGIVPELASREHVNNLIPLLRTGLKQAKLGLKDIDAIAVTSGPGLIGALLVGLSFAKGLAYALNIPYYGVNHLEGHLLSPFLEPHAPPFPYLGLLVSGGHTALYEVKDFGSYTCLGTTRDDAVGECYDKVARLLGLGYPGGPALDKLAQKGNPQAIDLPHRVMGKDSLDFSFSGIKTAVANKVDKHKRSHQNKLTSAWLNDMASSFQAACVDILSSKTQRAAEQSGSQHIVVTGGVAANQGLRQRMQSLAQAKGWQVYFPSLKYCTDNAAMIALAGQQHLKKGERSGWNTNAQANWLLP